MRQWSVVSGQWSDVTSLTGPRSGARLPIGRRGITFLELTIALTILGLAMTLVAEMGLWSLSERRQAAARHEALEVAANVLESARALPPESLTAKWAADQRLPESMARRLPDGTLTVRVDPVASAPQIKCVTVAIEWKLDNGVSARPVQLTGLFTAWSAELAGGKP